MANEFRSTASGCGIAAGGRARSIGLARALTSLALPPPSDAFLAVTKWNDDTDPVAYGFMIRDGKIGDLVSGRRIVERCPERGWVTNITIEARDEFGRELHAQGRRLSGIIINRHSFIDCNGLIEWTINGKTGHGEDQDMWPVHRWSAFRRGARTGAKA